MFDAPARSENRSSPEVAPALQRTRGRALVELAEGRGATRLVRLHQSGSAKAFLPRTHGPAPEVVFLNTAGGLTGGDRMDFALTLGPGARATATTQTAERAYRALTGNAEVSVTLAAGAGACLDWLPQETILFDGASLCRRTEARLSGDARLLMCEMLTLGRAAMGEEVVRLSLSDRRTVTRDGRPVHLEPLAIDTADLASRTSAGLGSARALATLAFVAPGAEDALGSLRDLAPPHGVASHASAWDGRLVLRAMAPDPWPLRRHLARVIIHLRRGPLPRVWQL